MPQYLIERPLPGAGKLSATELQGVSAKSNAVLRELGPDVQWVHSYVTDDAIHCVYNATGEDVIRQHAQRGGFPCESVREVKTMIDPTTGGL